ncbi:MAG: Uma2 family endonuclease [Bacteroidota bacterium]
MGAAEKLQPQKLTVQEYFELERTSDIRHDYHGGEIVNLAGASKRHNRIIRNLILALDPAIREKGCDIHVEGVMTQVHQMDTFVYPDAVISCEREEDDPYLIESPQIIMEVLSPSTETYDRGLKLKKYMATPSIRQVILISQNETKVEVYKKQSDTFFEVHILSKLEEEIQLTGMNITFSLTDIYRGIS